MDQKNKIKLALICGGKSAERDVSLAGAEEVKKAINSEKYNVTVYDPAEGVTKIAADAHRINVAFILLHGRYGEDGTIQGLLDMLGIPYQGSGVLGSALAMDKHLSKIAYQWAGIPTPSWITIDNHAACPDAEEICHRLGLPLMIKPCGQGSSVGMTLVTDTDELDKALAEAFHWDSKVMVERFTAGREITSSIIGNRELEALPLVEIIPDSRYAFFNTEAKYKPGATREICPARIPDDIAQKAQELGIRAHRTLGLRGYSRTDMILSKHGRLNVLETNTIPGMTPTSLFPQAAGAAGMSFSALIDRLIQLAMEEQ